MLSTSIFSIVQTLVQVTWLCVNFNAIVKYFLFFIQHCRGVFRARCMSLVGEIFSFVVMPFVKKTEAMTFFAVWYCFYDVILQLKLEFELESWQQKSNSVEYVSATAKKKRLFEHHFCIHI